MMFKYIYDSWTSNLHIAETPMILIVVKVVFIDCKKVIFHSYLSDCLDW